MTHTMKIEIWSDDGNESFEVEMPMRFNVCDRCEGHGSHSNPSIDGNGITSSEWAEWDEDDRETYLSGGYDVTCEECKGARVVKGVDEERLTPDQRADYERWQEQEAEAAHDRAVQARYCRMEAGGY